jgi:hypothetical protein
LEKCLEKGKKCRMEPREMRTTEKASFVKKKKHKGVIHIWRHTFFDASHFHRHFYAKALVLSSKFFRPPSPLNCDVIY